MVGDLAGLQGSKVTDFGQHKKFQFLIVFSESISFLNDLFSKAMSFVQRNVELLPA